MRLTLWPFRGANYLVPVSLVALVAACRKDPPPIPNDEPKASPAPQVAAPEKKTQAVAPEPPTEGRSALRLGPPMQVLHLDRSAYGPRLFLDEGEIVLLCDDAVYRMAQDKPLVHKEVTLGYHYVLTEQNIVSHRDGAFYRGPKSGERQERWFASLAEPRELAFHAGQLYWLEKNGSGASSLKVRMAQGVREIYSTPHALSGLTLLGKKAYFLQTEPPNGWRIGAIPVAGGPVTFGAPHATRVPATLRGQGSSLHYYDGLSGGVRRVSADLAQDEALRADWICSPMAVGPLAIACASVGSIGLITLDGQHTTRTTSPIRGPVTAIVVSDRFVAWLVDTGREQLLLEVAAFDFEP